MLKYLLSWLHSGLQLWEHLLLKFVWHIVVVSETEKVLLKMNSLTL